MGHHRQGRHGSRRDNNVMGRVQSIEAMSTYIAIWFALCSLSVAWALSEDSMSGEAWWRRLGFALAMTILAPFLILWANVIVPISDKFDGFFQWKIWWRYCFNRKSMIRTTEELDNMAAITRQHKNTNHPGHVGWRMAFRAICKVNGYTYKP